MGVERQSVQWVLLRNSCPVSCVLGFWVVPQRGLTLQVGVKVPRVHPVSPVLC